MGALIPARVSQVSAVLVRDISDHRNVNNENDGCWKSRQKQTRACLSADPNSEMTFLDLGDGGLMVGPEHLSPLCQPLGTELRGECSLR